MNWMADAKQKEYQQKWPSYLLRLVIRSCKLSSVVDSLLFGWETSMEYEAFYAEAGNANHFRTSLTLKTLWDHHMSAVTWWPFLSQHTLPIQGHYHWLKLWGLHLYLMCNNHRQWSTFGSVLWTWLILTSMKYYYALMSYRISSHCIWPKAGILNLFFSFWELF